MSVFVQDLQNALTIQPDEVGSKYIYRFFSCGVAGWKMFVAKLPANWTLIVFENIQGHPSCVFQVN